MRFSRGPIYIGRQAGSQIFLPDRAVSRRHAIIYNSKEGDWVAEDLDSSNKTYLNDVAINKAVVRSGDKIRISEFVIEITLENGVSGDHPINLQDTIQHEVYEQQNIIRRFEGDDAPAIRLPVQRMIDFSLAACTLCNTCTHDQLLAQLLEMLLKQFSAHHAWVALRKTSTGPMTTHGGRKRTTEAIQLAEIAVRETITHAAERHEYTLLPRLAANTGSDPLRSAMIAPLLVGNDCYGVLYVANSPDHERYSLVDLDYLILIAIQTAAVVPNI